MIISHEPPGPWQSFTKRKDNIGLPIMEVKQKYMKEQLLFESYLQQLSTVSTAAAGAAGGPAPGGGGGGGGGEVTQFNFYQSSGLTGGALDIELNKITATFVGESFNVPTIIAGYASNASYMYGYDNIEGRWKQLPFTIRGQIGSNWDYRTKTDEEMQAIWLDWAANTGTPFTTFPDVSSPTDSSSPIGSYEVEESRGPNYISAITPFSMTREEAQSTYGVN